jgi:hypothetical protein
MIKSVILNVHGNAITLFVHVNLHKMINYELAPCIPICEEPDCDYHCEQIHNI